MKHPNKKNQEYQEKFLSKLPANEREEHARMFRFGNASYIYHQRSKEFKPTQSDFQEWLTGLPENIGNDMKKKGFEACKNILSFSRYVMEKNDVGMDEFMKQNLNESDYEKYINIIRKTKND